ncbi:hypothetical protein E2C01_009012 [Portunus trituberculatus]|uniref:Uncharacterized protein n=1 Tax=Portunus trituberculatus TaxID=210409 RepID=A0A5B7D2A6_PORTR|nr:hypothetical protein [Portunus trituberculatus]
MNTGAVTDWRPSWRVSNRFLQHLPLSSFPPPISLTNTPKHTKHSLTLHYCLTSQHHCFTIATSRHALHHSPPFASVTRQPSPITQHASLTSQTPECPLTDYTTPTVWIRQQNPAALDDPPRLVLGVNKT